MVATPIFSPTHKQAVIQLLQPMSLSSTTQSHQSPQSATPETDQPTPSVAVTSKCGYSVTAPTTKLPS